MSDVSSFTEFTGLFSGKPVVTLQQGFGSTRMSGPGDGVGLLQSAADLGLFAIVSNFATDRDDAREREFTLFSDAISLRAGDVNALPTLTDAPLVERIDIDADFSGDLYRALADERWEDHLCRIFWVDLIDERDPDASMPVFYLEVFAGVPGVPASASEGA